MHIPHHLHGGYFVVVLKLKMQTTLDVDTTTSTSDSGLSPVGSPAESVPKSPSNLAENKEDLLETVEGAEGSEAAEVDEQVDDKRIEGAEDEEARVSFSPNFASVDFNSPANSETESNASEYGSIPGAEPTPPPEPSPDYPKIRIKTTGLLKEPLTITEITDDNPDGDPNYNHNNSNAMWTTPSLEDPLKLPDGDDNIMSLFNNNERAKDLGFHSSDSEFISLDRLEERNRGTMQLYNPSTSQGPSPLDSLTGLPMQALAQQVSRLQPSGANGLHQQNVLINIQQFPSGPPQPSYQPPPMYPHYPPQPMHQPYQYQPPNHMYYPAPPGYPPQHMPPPPQPQLTPLGQAPMGQQPMNQPPMGQQMPQNQMPPSSQPQNNQMPQPSTPYRQPMHPRQAGPRQPTPGSRMPNGPRPPMGQRQPMNRQRAPMMRPRMAGGMTAVRSGVRPRMGAPPNGMRQQQSPVKRTPEQMQALQAKKKRFDLLTPDKDDEDCQVICMQPKNTDGGLPQIESVQGGTPEPSESSIMHLSDSITLSVRNPPPKPVSPKKSDAKAVANILATRGITGPNSGENLPTVDLTDDTGPPQSSPSPQKQRPGLPFRCDLCPAQYPNAVGLNKHRQTYHKTTGGMCELGIPLINLKQPGIVQKLSSLGINNYIPLPSAGPDGMFALPIINARAPGNVSALGANVMLSLGPVRTIPKPQNNVGNVAKQLNNQKS
ncbi:hypothetical protein NQ315_009678 [Exocentrus adspersus]|uniref:C2H2-type domain-containing protein n=1 Tax=Exocentrus adspersus TaxID=1586481 RepID=A0AAV8WHY4_9CUCU|nr:hypothetical protein NQ315_009678 [Exocentrus adspersus]